MSSSVDLPWLRKEPERQKIHEEKLSSLKCKGNIILIMYTLEIITNVHYTAQLAAGLNVGKRYPPNLLPNVTWGLLYSSLSCIRGHTPAFPMSLPDSHCGTKCRV